jgi:uncharacterized membrane protein (DUF485 family)
LEISVEQNPEEPNGNAYDRSDGYLAVASSEDFIELRRTFRRFVFPMTAAFLIWYALYVLLSTYAPGFMSKQVVGAIHLGLVLGLLQFVSTFAITMIYARWADRTFDQRAAELSERVLAHNAATEDRR